MSRFVKVFVPLFFVALGVATYLLPERPTSSSRAVVEKPTVASRATTPLPAAGHRAVPPSAAQTEPGGPAAPGSEDVDLDSPPTPAEAQQFAEEVQTRMAKLGVDSTQPPDLRIPAGAAENGFTVEPTAAELERMKQEFAETEKALQHLDRETPRDPQPPVTK